MGKRVTLRDVAEAAGVSVSAASLALRDHRRISEAKREEIKQIAHRLGYIYNRQAASLRSGVNDTVSICINDLHNPVFQEYLTSIEREFRQAGKLLLLCNAHEDDEIQREFIRRMQEQGSAGLLISPVNGTLGKDLRDMVRRTIPTVLFVRQLADGGFDHVVNDDFQGVQTATKTLIQMGHRRIGWIGGGQMTANAQDRIEGYLAGLNSAGLPIDHALIDRTDQTTLEAGRQVMRRILSHAPDVTAVVCYGDLLALGATRACRDAGRVVGGDISIIGHDDIEEASYFEPGLSTIRVDKTQLGRRAAQILLRRIEAPDAAPIHEVIAPSLVLRGTTAAGPFA